VSGCSAQQRCYRTSCMRSSMTSCSAGCTCSAASMLHARSVQVADMDKKSMVQGVESWCVLLACMLLHVGTSNNRA
jgi:hypothetical protein